MGYTGGLIIKKNRMSTAVDISALRVNKTAWTGDERGYLPASILLIITNELYVHVRSDAQLRHMCGFQRVSNRKCHVAAYEAHNTRIFRSFCNAILMQMAAIN